MKIIASVLAATVALLTLVSASPVELERRADCSASREFGPYYVTHVPENHNLSQRIGYPGDLLQWSVSLSGNDVGELPNGTLRWFNYLYETNKAAPTYVGSPRAKGAYQIITVDNYGTNSSSSTGLTSQYAITAQGLTNNTAYTMAVSTINGQGKIVCPLLSSFQFTYMSRKPVS